MAIRLPTVEDVIRSMKERPDIFLFGTILGLALGIYLGWANGSSGLSSTKARAELLAVERDKYKDDSERNLQKISNLTSKLQQNALNLKRSEANQKLIKDKYLKVQKAFDMYPIHTETQINDYKNLVFEYEKQKKEVIKLQQENINLKNTVAELNSEIEKRKSYNERESRSNTEIDSLRALAERGSLRNRLSGHYISVRPIIKNDEYVRANFLVGGTVHYELTIPESGDFFKSKLIGRNKNIVAIVDSQFTSLSPNKFKLKEMERRRVGVQGAWFTGFTWNGTLTGNQIVMTSTDQQDKYIVTLEKASGI